MALCQTCGQLYDATPACPRCGRSAGFGIDLLGTAEGATLPRPGTGRPSLARRMPRFALWELLVLIASIGLTYAIWQLIAPRARDLGAPILATVGGISVAGWIRMLLVAQREYERRDVLAWWSIAAWVLGYPIGIGLVTMAQDTVRTSAYLGLGVLPLACSILALVASGEPRAAPASFQIRCGVALAWVWAILGPAAIALWV